MSGAAIDVDGFRKRYGDLVAVSCSSFSVTPGEIVGLVGPNGAGKTTTLKALVGLIEPSDGTVVVAGGDPRSGRTRRRIGWLPEESALYDEMTPLSYLQFFADLYDVPRSTATPRIESTLDRLDLETRDRALGDCSKGMRRKVAIARAVVNDPDVLVFDEPASGLDPLTTKTVLSFTDELAEEGKTVLFSAHNLHHVESVSDRVAIMSDGDIIARGPVSDLRDRFGTTRYDVFTSVRVPGSTPLEDRFRTTVDSMDEVEQIRTEAVEAGGSIEDIRTQEPSLEEIFLELTDTAKSQATDRAVDSSENS